MNIVGYSLVDAKLLFELERVTEKLKQVFDDLKKEGSTSVEKYSLEREKDKCFKDLNEILPQLTEQDGQYGNYIKEKIIQIYN